LRNAPNLRRTSFYAILNISLEELNRYIQKTRAIKSGLSNIRLSINLTYVCLYSWWFCGRVFHNTSWFDSKTPRELQLSASTFLVGTFSIVNQMIHVNILESILEYTFSNLVTKLYKK